MGMTLVGTGRSLGGTSAAHEATEKAKRALGGAKASYGFAFCSPSHRLGGVLATVEEVAEGAHVIGCQTAGEFTHEGLSHGGVVVMLVASRDEMWRVDSAANVAADPAAAADRLCAGGATLARDAKLKGYGYSTTVLLVDGLNGAGEPLLSHMADRMPAASRIIGGAAGDAGAFKATQVGAKREAMQDGAVALHLAGAARWGVGVGHGLKPMTNKMRVTKAKKNVIFEIDHKPAFTVYAEHAATRGVRLDRDNASEYMIANELGVFFLNELVKARAPLSVGVDGSLSCAAEVPQGSWVCILDGDPTNMVSAAKSAAQEALRGLGDRKPAGVLVFDCVCRGTILGGQFQKEIDATRSVLGNVPVAGFLTYGEIARYGALDGWHNTTAVVVAIPA